MGLRTGLLRWGRGYGYGGGAIAGVAIGWGGVTGKGGVVSVCGRGYGMGAGLWDWGGAMGGAMEWGAGLWGGAVVMGLGAGLWNRGGAIRSGVGLLGLGAGLGMCGRVQTLPRPQART